MSRSAAGTQHNPMRCTLGLKLVQCFPLMHYTWTFYFLLIIKKNKNKISNTQWKNLKILCSLRFWRNYCEEWIMSSLRKLEISAAIEEDWLALTIFTQRPLRVGTAKIAFHPVPKKKNGSYVKMVNRSSTSANPCWYTVLCKEAVKYHWLHL